MSGRWRRAGSTAGGTAAAGSSASVETRYLDAPANMYALYSHRVSRVSKNKVPAVSERNFTKFVLHCFVSINFQINLLTT